MNVEAKVKIKPDIWIAGLIIILTSSIIRHLANGFAEIVREFTSITITFEIEWRSSSSDSIRATKSIAFRNGIQTKSAPNCGTTSNDMLHFHRKYARHSCVSTSICRIWYVFICLSSAGTLLSILIIFVQNSTAEMVHWVAASAKWCANRPVWVHCPSDDCGHFFHLFLIFSWKRSKL